MSLFHVKQETPTGLAFLDEGLAHADSRGLLRSRPPPCEAWRPSFCSNDYLDLAGRMARPEASGSGASRLVSGDRPIHAQLEAEAAALVRQPASLAFTSGYAANVGLIAALAGPGDTVISDSLNHASIIDGARLSRARVVVVPHLDAAAVARALEASRRGRAFVVTESYFSMDADAPDLAALRRVTELAGAALLVDEAHALGVLGPEGAGLCAEHGVRADAVVGTFGKAFGAGGAFVAGCPALVAWLWNRARSFVYSTGLSPVVAAAALEGIRTAREEPERRHRVKRASVELRGRLAAVGDGLRGFGHIVPWVVGESRHAVELAAALCEEGIDVRAIRPPSVPEGTARLRLTVTATHTSADLERLAGQLAACGDRGHRMGLR